MIVAAKLLPIIFVGDEAVSTHVPRRETGCNIVSERDVDVALSFHFVVGAVGNAAIGFVSIKTRLPGENLKDADRAVLPEERALRALQNFDVVDIRERLIGGRGKVGLFDALHNIVYYNSDVLFTAQIDALRPDATDLKSTTGISVVLDARHDELQVAQTGIIGRLQLIARYDRNRGRHVMQPLGASLGGDHDAFDLADLRRLSGRIDRLHGLRLRNCRNTASACEQGTKMRRRFHVFLPWPFRACTLFFRTPVRFV